MTVKSAIGHALDVMLAKRSLSHADFEAVDRFRDEGFDYVANAVVAASAAHSKINGLRLLVRVGHRISERSGTHRLREVNVLAAALLGDSESDVRMVAARTIAGVFGLLRMTAGELAGDDGDVAIAEALRRARALESSASVRMWLEKAIAAMGPRTEAPRGDG